MIEGSIKKTEGGTRIARDTSEALNKIVDQIERVSNLVNDIAVASNEQNSGISQINLGIMQVSQVVQTNSATSEESAAESEELSSQADILKEMVRKVKLKKSDKVLNKLENISLDVLKMLEEMSHKAKPESFEMSGVADEKPVKKIVLSDNEFDKY